MICVSRCQHPFYNSFLSVAPTIQELKSSGVVLGGNGLIRCEGAGVPAPIFEWYKGERKLINGQQGITIKNYSTRSLLTVTNVTEEHFGNYTCVATNKLGTTNASLPLNQIIEPTTSSAVSSPGWISEKGSSCRVWLDTEHALQGSGHDPKAARAQGAFGECSQKQGGIVGVSVQGQELDLVIPVGSSNSGYSLVLRYAAPSTAQYGITGDAEVLFSCWYLVLTLSSLSSIFYLKNIILH
ncbi:hypothetical protein BTVI_95591 [Pitangus sulphuratus]|nr:hypothetical protein BTVI_95591 [Pitangus sulphuratus]